MAQTVQQRLACAAVVWEMLDDLGNQHGLPDRTLDLMFSAVVGFRLRRTSYVRAAAVDERTATRDFKRLADVGLLRPVGETKGRYYVAGEGLSAVVAVMRDGDELTEPTRASGARCTRSPGSFYGSMWRVHSDDGWGRGASADGPPPLMIWRVGRPGLILSRIGIAVSAVTILALLAWLPLTPDADRVQAGGVIVLCLTVGLGLWRTGIRPSVAATETGLTITNPLRSVTVDWVDIVRVSADFDGITVHRLSAPPAVIWAVQKSKLSEWLLERSRADDVVDRIQQLATERGATLGTGGELGREALEPWDAYREPLPFPWRMTWFEAGFMNGLRHSPSPFVVAAWALFCGGAGVLNLGIVMDDAWDDHVLRDRGVVVEGTVVDSTRLIEVTWPAIAPRTVGLLRGGLEPDEYAVGAVVDVLSDPHHPARARLVGVDPLDSRGGETVGHVATSALMLLMADVQAKWARWLFVHRHDPPSRGRHRADPSA
ncbi:PH domain-containing protein [Sanguibacter sp. 25GB23B1]|uniref:PH domain-containing protein n=1 Tax=unclassified Sanguibacter TaxID=2645534 RepID=UPI0032AFE79E